MHAAKRGLIADRNFVNKIVQADGRARFASIRAASRAPLFAAFDHGAAFANILHSYMLSVLHYIGIPLGHYNIIKSVTLLR